MKQAHRYLLAGIVIGLAIAASALAIDKGLENPASARTFNGTIMLTGDAPKDISIQVSDIFSLKMSDVPSIRNRTGEESSVGVPVPEFLAAYGIDEYDRLSIYADDYQVTINKSNVTNEMIFVPDSASVRLLGGNLPINSWVKNVRYVVVVDEDAGSSILLNGRKISYGNMLDDGISTMPFYRMSTIYRPGDREFKVETAGVAHGISLAAFLFREGYPGFSNVTISGGGSTESFDREEVLIGSLFLTRFHDDVKLATNDTLQSGWKTVDSIEVE